MSLIGRIAHYVVPCALTAALSQVGAGETIIHQGDPSDAFYLLVRGLLRVEAAELVEPGR